MAVKLWRGDAPAVAQVTHVDFANVQIGDQFSLTINGKVITVTATAATATNVADLFVNAIGASDIPEWQELTATNDAGVLVLTANTPGVPFVVTGSDTNASTLGVSIATTQTAVAASNQKQTFRIPLSAAGTFTITIGDQTTSGIAVGASAATVDTAVEGLSTIGAGNCTVTKTTDANDDIYELAFSGALAGVVVATAIVRLTSTKPLVRTTQAGATTGTPQNEIQTIECGSGTGNFDLTLAGNTTSLISPASTAAQVQTAIEALGNVETVTVTKDSTVGAVTFTVEFTGIDGSANQSQMTASAWSAGNSVHAIAVAVAPPTAAVNEKQTVTLTGAPTGGTFTLTYSGQTTSGIAYNASAATLDAALEALSNIGAGDVTVTGDAGGPWVVEFTGALAQTDVALMAGSGASLTGGSSETITVSAFVASSGPNHWDTAANWVPSGVPITGDDVRFEIGNSDCLYGLAQSGVTLASLRVMASYTGSIGLPRQNRDGYFEYRTPALTCGITSVLIGHGEGAGSGKIALATGSVQTNIEIRSSGGSNDSGAPAVTWFGTHASNVVTMFDGDFGSALWSDQTATIDVMTVRGGSARLHNTAIDELYAPNGTVKAHNCTLGGRPLEL